MKMSIVSVLFLVFSGRVIGLEDHQSVISSLPNLRAYHGKIVVLNFWATWCKPCKKEIPALMEIQRQYESLGVQVTGASIDEPEDRKKAEEFVHQTRVNYPMWFGCTIEQMLPLGLATSIPATAILDQAGQRRFRIIGEAKKADISERLDWLLGNRSAPAPPELLLPAGITPEHFRLHEEGKEEGEEHDEPAIEGGSAVPS
jgi:thiol-disulfide isomerase/thioredoxin